MNLPISCALSKCSGASTGAGQRKSEAGWHDVVTARLSTADSGRGRPSFVIRARRPRTRCWGSLRQAVQVDGIPPPPVGRADPIPDATGELDDSRLAGHPAQPEQFADWRGSPVRGHDHHAQGTRGKDDLPRRLHSGSRISDVRRVVELTNGMVRSRVSLRRVTEAAARLNRDQLVQEVSSCYQ